MFVIKCYLGLEVVPGNRLRAAARLSVSCVLLLGHVCVLCAVEKEVPHLYKECLLFFEVVVVFLLVGLRWLSVNDCSRVLDAYAALSN
jgi:hypothetical protein